jgi:hypothetical protein
MIPRLGINSLAIQVNIKEGDSTTLTKNITFMNEGEGVMVWAARKTQPWLWLDERDGVLEKGYSKNLQVFIAPSGKGAGTYTDNITIEGAGTRNSPQNVVVTMVISPAVPVVGEADTSAMRKPVPPPPWEYSEYKDDNYGFRLRYPKEYQEKLVVGSTFSAISYPGKPSSDSIMLLITSAYGVDYEDASLEWAKTAIRSTGGKPNPKLVSSENITLQDGVTQGFELVYDSKSATTASYEVYIQGVKKGNRYILFAGISALSTAAGKIPRWREIARTLEFIGRD